MESFLLRMTDSRVYRSRFALILVAVLASCSGGSSPSTSSDSQVLSATTQTVTVASGGTLSLPSGETLVIPPGALTQDTTITMQTLAVPPAGAAVSLSLPTGYEAAGPVVELLPDGLTFAPNSPARLTFPIVSPNPDERSYLIHIDSRWE
jgi:hypothetical protein